MRKFGKQREAKFRRDITAVIHAHMPWPFSDVDRDSQEARETAKDIFDKWGVPMLEEFDSILEDVRRTREEAKANG